MLIKVFAYSLSVFRRLKLAKSASGESVNKDTLSSRSGDQWGSSSELEKEQQQQEQQQPTVSSSSGVVAMGAMNGNPSMRSSTGAGTLMRQTSLNHRRHDSEKSLSASPSSLIVQ